MVCVPVRMRAQVVADGVSTTCVRMLSVVRMLLLLPVVQLPERAEKRASPMKKSLPFFGSTEYGDMHTGPGFNLDDDTGDMAGYKPRPEESAPFDGRTEARSAFVPHPLDGTRKGTKAKSHGIGVGEGAFQGATESREAFPGHNVRAVCRAGQGCRQ